MSGDVRSEERYRREQQFHDQRFAGDERPADRFYAINGACTEHYRRAIGFAGPGVTVLEYGCGTGSEAFALAAAGADVTGIDISPVAVDEARREAQSRGLENARFEVMNAEHLELEDQSFDLVCGSGILHHLQLDTACREVARVLTDRGRGVFVEPLGHNPVINLYRRATPGMRTDDEHPLLAPDLVSFEQSFERVTTDSYALTALAAIPFSRSARIEAVVAPLDRFDAALFRRWPSFGRFAWTVVIELAGPWR
jgi:SAM-dependent methyltransferase